jgi:ribonuclease VapC
MIVDSSALLCVFFDEPDALVFVRAMRGATILRIGAPTYFESCIVAGTRHGSEALPELDRLVRISNIEIVAFTKSAALFASDVFMRYGKGRHPAGLNFGDCMSYALAKTEMMPLLFKGNDFRLTDIEAAL